MHTHAFRCQMKRKSVGTLVVTVLLISTSYFAGYRLLKSGVQIPVVSSLPGSRSHVLWDDTTVVTAYFDLGRFQKGEGAGKHSPGMYHEFMSIFKRIHNPLVAFVDTKESFRILKLQRSNVPAGLTRIFFIKRRGLWSFWLVPKIAKIFGNPLYPKHHPNTVIPEYSSVMHAKYELMSIAVTKNYFRTKYFCWIDIGLFKNDPGEHTDIFKLTVPPHFDSSRVAYTQVHYRNESLTPKQIFYENMVWVSGGFFFARYDVMLKWTREYRKFTEKFLKDGLMNTDQQIVYSMFSPAAGMTPSISLQAYAQNPQNVNWAYLGYLSKNTWIKRQSRHTAS